jgi:predicted nucleic acid-binding protein
MILLDSTVVIGYLRVPTSRLRTLFQRLKPAISGVTRAEVLHGARDSAHLGVLTTAVDQFAQHPTPADIWDDLGTNMCSLRLRGITVPFPDALIATLAIRADMELWTYDNHFRVIQSVLPLLRLFSEPP